MGTRTRLVLTEALSFLRREPASIEGQAYSSRQFDWAMLLFLVWSVVGLYIDGWAHRHLASARETFFTPWHAVLYAGMFGAIGLFLGAVVRFHRRGYLKWRAVPRGYELALFGAIIVPIGAVGDMTWHILFGFERNVAAAVSPTHLIVATGGSLLATGPLRATWIRSAESGDHGWAAQLPVLLVLSVFLCLCTFFTQFAQPFSYTVGAASYRPPPLGADVPWYNPPSWNFYAQDAGMAGVIVHTALLMSVVLLVLRWTTLRWGFTALFTINTVMMTLESGNLSTGPLPLIGVGVVGGIAADVLRSKLRPSEARPATLRVFAFAVPTVLYILYFVLLLVTGGLWWDLPVWTGAILLAGITGWLLSYAFVSPIPLTGVPVEPTYPTAERRIAQVPQQGPEVPVGS